MPRKANIARRREIARKSFEILRARGVQQTTMSDIAAELGMKRPTLYWYFRSFGEIFEAVVAETDAELKAFVLGRLDGITHPIDTLAELVEATIDFWSSRRDQVMGLFQLWAVTGEVAPETISARSRDFVAPVRRELCRRLEQGMADGLVAPCDPETVVDLAFAVIDGAQVQRVTREADPRRILDGLRTYLFEPLRLEPDTQP